MITSFVKNGQAYLKCTECGAESIILKYEIVERHDFPIINHEKTIDGIQLFNTMHALCKKAYSQAELQLEVKEKT